MVVNQEENQPLRGDLCSFDRLGTCAIELAQRLSVVGGKSSAPTFMARFAENAQLLRKAVRYISSETGDGAVTPDAEWLLDNFYVVEDQLREIRDDLPAGYLKELPKTGQGEPRLYCVAVELIMHTDSALELASITKFLEEFQTIQPLSIGEVWAVPIMLRLVLVENLRRVSQQLLCGRCHRSELIEALKGWSNDSPLPETVKKLLSNHDTIAHCLSIAPELFPEDADRATNFEKALQEAFPQAQEYVAEANRRRASNQVTIGNIVTSMRLITAIDWFAFFERTSLVEQLLLTDPAGIYGKMDSETRNRYRMVIERLAKGSGQSDLEVTRAVLGCCTATHETTPDATIKRHVGYWLVDAGLEQLELNVGFRASTNSYAQRLLLKHPNTCYFGGLFATWTVAMAVIEVLLFRMTSAPVQVLMLALAAVPTGEFANLLWNWVLTHWLTPRLLPKLEYKTGIPHEHRTIVVVPSMLTGEKEIGSLLHRLEMHYVANDDPELKFGLLTDLRDSSTQVSEGDDHLIAHAVHGIRALNERYKDTGETPFFLLHRARLWNSQEGVWMGWERKRGKLVEFNRLLHGDQATTYTVREGDIAELVGTPEEASYPFVITLDADTQLPPGSARRLIAAIAHPLNRAQLSQDSGVVVRGYGLLQPRVAVRLVDGQRSRYTQLFGNGRGVDPYATAASDIYQDVFGEGSFTGKGIYDVGVTSRTIDEAFPENQILSHDLIEGCHARVGLVSDIEVVDGTPARYDAEARRTHRWVRGDWQLLPWLFRRVPSPKGMIRNRLNLVSRWKIIDNLRRSMVPPTLLLMMVVGWILVPSLAGLWSCLGILCLGFPAVSTGCTFLLGWTRVQNISVFIRNMRTDLVLTAGQLAVLAAGLPFQALLMVDAISRTVYRLYVSHSRMLEWETSAATELRLADSRWSIWRQMGIVPILAIVVAYLLPAPSWAIAGPWLLLWLASPLIADLISQPLTPKHHALTESEKLWLRRHARRIWSFFEDNVNARTNWLPPDNLQEYPHEKLAERVSPTNEGLYLVSGLIARDFGYVGLHQVCELWERSLSTVAKLETLNGHIYNWYDTATLHPLTPRYVSTVDSGNMAALLLVLEQGVLELCARPIFGQEMFEGLRDTVAVARERCQITTSESSTKFQLLQRRITIELVHINDAVAKLINESVEFETAWSTICDSAKSMSDLLAESTELPQDRHDGVVMDVLRVVRCVYEIERDVELLKPATASLKSEQDSRHEEDWSWTTESLNGLSETCKSHDVSGMTTCPAMELRNRLLLVASTAAKIVDGMKFEFLYNPQRRLFSIGFNVESGQSDRSYYDMLCSEARLSSHLAIAFGQAPEKHWFQLGRQVTATAGHTGLLSWGGTMFEYMMPTLLQRIYPESLLAQACDAAIARQMEYGQQHGVPWGISESGFAVLAVNSDYHYQSFGVPGLGLKRGLSKDLVIAPYATMMVLQRSPAAAIENLRRLESEGATGRYGFYEAVDYTPERMPAGKTNLVVRSYMAHHLGMSFSGLDNLLMDGALQRRFRANPRIQATEALLQEAMSVATPLLQPHTDEVEGFEAVHKDREVVSRSMVGYDSPVPRTHLLANGSYSVMLTNTGGGFSRWKDIAINRWRSDSVRDIGGHYFYLRDLQTRRRWSATYQPTGAEPDSYHVTFSIDKAEYVRIDGSWETRLEVAVSSDDPVEVRQLTLKNNSDRERIVEITSLVEISLTNPAADLAHPAFQKLFVETEFVPEETALLARRRPREPHQEPLWAMHVLAGQSVVSEDVQVETSRFQFIGRGRDEHDPIALQSGARLSGSTGAVLDPIFSIRCFVTVPPHGTATLAFSTGVAASREEIMRLADQFHELRHTRRAFELAWAFQQVQLQHLHLSARQAQRFQQFTSCLLFPQAAARGSSESIRKNHQGQNALWRFGVSGDRPIVLVKIVDEEQLPFAREVLKAREFWERYGLAADVVVLNLHPGSYFDALQDQLQQMILDSSQMYNDAQGQVFAIRGAQITLDDHWLFDAAASMVLEARRGWTSILSLFSGVSRPSGDVFVGRLAGLPSLTTLRRSTGPAVGGFGRSPADFSATTSSSSEKFWNSLGGFSADGREYRLQLNRETQTPLPWSNVIANPRFGCLVTESGGGYTWSENSRENKLTSWSNDAVSDAAAETLWIRDARSGQLATLLGNALPPMKRDVAHGQGFSRFATNFSDVSIETTISIACEDPIKLVLVKLKNEGSSEKTLAMTYFADLVMGVAREQTRMHLVTDRDPQSGGLVVQNRYRSEYPDQVVFLNVIGPNTSIMGDRADFLGRKYGSHPPAGLLEPRLAGRFGPGHDPCAAAQCVVKLAAGASDAIAFVFGSGENNLESMQLLTRYQSIPVIEDAIDAAIRNWDNMLSAVHVETPNKALDLLINRWLPYQVLSCRLWGRSAFYQSGGAYGFRDQLQDVMALVYCRPDLMREHLLRAAARQFQEGDVQHWWHPPFGRGTRTRFSDDLLFLPFAVTHYVRVTGDHSVLDEVVPFLQSSLLAPEEQERYETPQISTKSATLYEHCRLAIEKGFTRGEHGLPLMGCGDWNDGMNLVGAEGKGESVWVGWFLLTVIDGFLELANSRNDQELADHLKAGAVELRDSIEAVAWDGEWYLRAFFDDGTPLGSRQNDECQIDSLTQSWSVIAGGDKERSRIAIQSALSRLVFPADGLIALFQPPFDRTALEPGYIKGYVPGVRENGGQYTHAVAWLIQAVAMSGDGQQAMELFDLINPILLSSNSTLLQRYKAEPYVMSADVYLTEQHRGRGGWSWYTGSAAWMYRVALESLLGVHREGDRLYIRPNLPRSWDSYIVSVRVGASFWRLKIQFSDDDQTASLQPLMLSDDGQPHDLTVIVQRNASANDMTSQVPPPKIFRMETEDSGRPEFASWEG